VIDARTPVIVGVGQAEQRPDDPTDALEPIDLLAVAARAADDDANGTRSLLATLDTAAIVSSVSWPYPDPGSLLARRLGAADVRRTILTTIGGNSPQLLVNHLADAIAAGDSNVALIGGVECLYSKRRASHHEPKIWLPWTEGDAPPCPEVLGDTRPGNSEYEIAHLAAAPIDVYPLFETALRATAGRSVDEHQRVVSSLWAGFAAVAADNPHAWSRIAYTAEQIRTAGPDNRMVTFPYTKLMCARIAVDQAAALVVCSYEAAKAAGVPDDQLVFPLAGADAHDHYFFSQRDRLDISPAVRAATQATLHAAGIDLDDVARFDLYSCFPSAVQITMGSIGLGGPAAGDGRPLTVTGGLGFAGGPANDYPTHAIARMVEALRADPGSTGLVHAIGWYATKHSVGCYSTTPPTDGFVHAGNGTIQAEVDALPRREPAGLHDGDATVEATAVAMDRDGHPSHAIISLLATDGRRVLANAHDADSISSMTEEPWEGRTVRVTNDGSTNTLLV
jgi:acetyl-CoA C-acetyltransferase